MPMGKDPNDKVVKMVASRRNPPRQVSGVIPPGAPLMGRVDHLDGYIEAVNKEVDTLANKIKSIEGVVGMHGIELDRLDVIITILTWFCAGAFCLAVFGFLMAAYNLFIG